MKIKFNVVIAMLTMALLSSNVEAAFIDVTAGVTINGANGVLGLYKANGSPFSITFSDASAVETVLYSDNENVDVGNQSPAHVGEIIKDQFNLLSVTEVDKAGNGRIVSKNGPFQYLALHIGNDRELFFKFLFGIEEFNVGISKKDGGLGDWRAYNGQPIPPNEVPLPAAVWLFGSALAGMIGLNKKRRMAAAA